jgi:hypothetical protein
MNIHKKIKCPGCGATNIGIQEQCLLCGKALPTSEVEMVAQSPAAVSQAGATCSKCGAGLKAGNRFCTKCGTPVAG